MTGTLPLVLAQGAGGQELFNTLIFAVLIFGVIYFLILRPQRKKEKDRQAMLAKLERGDRVVTIGGIHGEVESVKERHVILLVDRKQGTTLKTERSAIHRIVSPESSDEEDK